MTGSDDGSKVYIDNKYVLNNDGLHGWRTRYANVRVNSGRHPVKVEFFENGGHAGCIFYYQGTDTGNRMVVVAPNSMEASTQEHGGWKEQIYYMGSQRRVPNYNAMRPHSTRTVPRIAYRNTGGNWPGFGRRDRFGVRWTGVLTIHRGGGYRFQTGSDDGSKVYIDNKYVLNNDGLHGWRTKSANVRVNSGRHPVKVEFFENGGHAGCIFYYQGTDTGNRMVVVPPNSMEAPTR